MDGVKVAAQGDIHGLGGVGGGLIHQLTVAGPGSGLFGVGDLANVVVDVEVLGILAAGDEAVALHLGGQGGLVRCVGDGRDEGGQDLGPVRRAGPGGHGEAAGGHVVVELEELLAGVPILIQHGGKGSGGVVLGAEGLHQHVLHAVHGLGVELVDVVQITVQHAVAIHVHVVLHPGDDQGHVALHGDIIGLVVGKGQGLGAEHAHGDGNVVVAVVLHAVEENLIGVRQVEVDGFYIVELRRRGAVALGIGGGEGELVGEEGGLGGEGAVIPVAGGVGAGPGDGGLIGPLPEGRQGALDLIGVDGPAVLQAGHGGGHVDVDFLRAVEHGVDGVAAVGAQVAAAGKAVAAAANDPQAGGAIVGHSACVDGSAAGGEVYRSRSPLGIGIGGIEGLAQGELSAYIDLPVGGSTALADGHGNLRRNIIIEGNPVRCRYGVVIGGVDQIRNRLREGPAGGAGDLIGPAAGVAGIGPSSVLNAEGEEDARGAFLDRIGPVHIGKATGAGPADA